MITFKKYNLEIVKEHCNSLGFKLLTTEYINVDQYLILEDNSGYLFQTTFYKLRNNIKLLAFHPANPYTIQNIKLWIKLNNKSFELLSEEYKRSDELLSFKCLKDSCGEFFKMSWNLVGHMNCGCPFCVGQKVGLSNCLATKNPDLAKQWHLILNGELTPYDVTCGCGKEIWWQCSKNKKHAWQAPVYRRNNEGTGCPYCAGDLPSEDYNLLVCNPILSEEWNYEKNDKNPEEYTPGSDKKVYWKCKECGWEWMSGIANRTNGRGCPKCSNSGGSKVIHWHLFNNNIFYDTEYTFSDLLSDSNRVLRFDFALFYDKEKTKLKTLIEFDGRQHYEFVPSFHSKEQFDKLQYHDKLKNEYCNYHNINLLRIRWDEFDYIEDILLENNIIQEFN